MTKHTPGPWIKEPGVGRGAWIKNAAGKWTALACGDTEEEAHANGTLITAAYPKDWRELRCERVRP